MVQSERLPLASIQYRQLSELRELPGNPRTIKKDQFEKLKKSIKDNADYFEVRPIILSDRTGELVILAGNQRYRAAKALGLKEVPTILLPNLTEEREKEIIIRDNVENGDWDWDELANAWDAASLTEWGVQVPDWASEPGSENVEDLVEDEIPELGKGETKVKSGEVWQLGEHRLMCGDSTDADAVAKLMNGERADIAFTSPPYNAGTSAALADKTHTRASKYLDSDDNLSDYDELLFNSTQNNIDFAKYAFINIQMLAGNKIVFCDFVEKFKNQLCDIAIWNKNNAQPAMARRVMNSQFEFIFIFSKDNSSRAVGTRDFRGNVPNVNNMNAQYENGYSAIHAATFSVEFAGYYIGNFSNDGEIILDTFGGTGTTMIGCEQLGRKCRMMELDPHYCDVIVERWEKFTGRKAEKIKESE